MTVCVAAVCENGNAVVVASDRMLTAPFLTVEFDHQDTKIDQINPSCVALSSGDALCVHDILIAAKITASQLQNPSIESLAEQIKVIFCSIRKDRINDLVFGPRGFDRDSFYRGGGINSVPPDLAMILDSAVQQQNLDSTLLLAGVDDSGAHIYCIEDPGVTACFDRLGYHAIGSGQSHAVLKLVAQGQHASSTINQSVFNVFSAKKIAELAPGVGQATTMKIVTSDETKPIEQGILDELGPIYEMSTKPISREIEAAISKLPF